MIGSLPLFQHLAEHHAQIRAMIGSRGIQTVTEAVHDSLRRYITEELERRSARGERHPVPVDARAAFLAGSLMAFATWWLDRARRPRRDPGGCALLDRAAFTLRPFEAGAEPLLRFVHEVEAEG